MNILIIADSHGKLTNVIEAYEKEKPCLILSAGDCMEDMENFGYVYDRAKVEFVKGNCDYHYTNIEEEKILELGGKKIFLTHGHLYGVKWGMEYIEKKANELGVDIVVFGHTHRQYIKKVGSIYYFNPGSIKEKMYGVMKISCREPEFLFKEI